jgi:hypothetical protein
MRRSAPFCIGTRTISGNFSSISDFLRLVLSLSIKFTSALQLAIEEFNALILVLVRNSSPSSPDISSPLPCTSNKLIKGCSSAEFNCSPTKTMSRIPSFRSLPSAPTSPMLSLFPFAIFACVSAKLGPLLSLSCFSEEHSFCHFSYPAFPSAILSGDIAVCTEDHPFSLLPLLSILNGPVVPRTDLVRSSLQ